MKKETYAKMIEYINKYSHTVNAEDAVALRITSLRDEHENNFFAKLKENDLFKILNLVPVNYANGEAVGFIQGMPSTTDTEQFERKPKLAAKLLNYYCQQMNIDSRKGK